MNNTIYPCLWFDGQAKAAAEFYCGLFPNSKITTDTPMVVQFEIEGKKIMGLNGGPMFKINPSISLFVTCQTDQEIETLASKLLEGGKAMMALDKYPWAEKYGWIEDKFGMTWQLMLSEIQNADQKIVPSFLFVGKQYGKAREAITHYTSIFKNSEIFHQEIYQEGEGQLVGSLKFGHFSLNNTMFSAMDGFGAHDFEFNEGLSLVVECDTQAEIDHFWDSLTEGGNESMCGWLKDKFGVSWQIIPKVIGSLMSDAERGGRVMQEVMKMKKIDLEVLLNA